MVNGDNKVEGVAKVVGLAGVWLVTSYNDQG